MLVVILLAALATLPALAQGERNLLDNPDGSSGAKGWLTNGQATTEPCGNDSCFVLRNKGFFQQTVAVPSAVEGWYAVYIAAGTSERVEPSGAITGLAYLGGTMITSDRRRILAHLQGQQMLARPTQPDVWVKMWGIFRIPPGTGHLVIALSQAERAGMPQNGSASRFDDVGIYLFCSEDEARTFVSSWKSDRLR